MECLRLGTRAARRTGLGRQFEKPISGSYFAWNKCRRTTHASGTNSSTQDATRSNTPIDLPSFAATDKKIPLNNSKANPELHKNSQTQQLSGLPYNESFLRDSCTCPKCVDTSTRQKNFQTADIPYNLKARDIEPQDNGDLRLTWENDIPGFGPDHVSTIPKSFLEIHSTRSKLEADRSQNVVPRLWHKRRITESLEYVEFNSYMKNDEELHRTLRLLNFYGLVIVRGVPQSETAVEDLACRIGNIRDTFYGRTWDVKSVPKAKNIAYTHQFLGLHMDLLYMTNPPGFQFLHCLQNTCEGGASLFSDSFHAVNQLKPEMFETLCKPNLAYHYRNAGEHYYYQRPLVEIGGRDIPSGSGQHQKNIKNVNYSPPFQAPLPMTGEAQHHRIPELLAALRHFSHTVEHPSNLLEYRLQVGECVIFNNRRVLHGRRQFEAGAGERWLKGTYVDTDVFMSKWRVLNERFNGALDRKHRSDAARKVFPFEHKRSAEWRPLLNTDGGSKGVPETAGSAI